MAERGYSFSLTTFSPPGKPVQIEYALAAVAGGAPSVGFKAANGAVLATEKKQKSTLYDERSIHKVKPVTKHICLVYSGMGQKVGPITKHIGLVYSGMAQITEYLYTELGNLLSNTILFTKNPFPQPSWYRE